MKLNRVYISYLFVFLISSLFVLNSCEDESSTEPKNYGIEDFSDYQKWNMIDMAVGQDPFLATAHGVTDNFIRVIYSNKIETPGAGSQFADGKIIVKELRNLDGEITGALTVMIKRGDGFNPSGNGWEWFMTNESRNEIATQGDNATAGDGMCAGCHSSANNPNNGIDWVFNHPKEFEIDLDDFSNFSNWTKIDENFGPDPFLATAHGVNDSFNRLVYSNFNLVPINSKYPTGTIIVKELRTKNNESVGPLTVMVKRGGNFNPAGNGWEWIMTNDTRNAIATRGDNATAGGGMCASCHSAATNSNNGTDWVFSH